MKRIFYLHGTRWFQGIETLPAVPCFPLLRRYGGQPCPEIVGRGGPGQPCLSHANPLPYQAKDGIATSSQHIRVKRVILLDPYQGK